MELQTIGKVSAEHGVSVRTLRYYEQIGLLSSQRQGDGAYRVYDEPTIQKLRQIIVLRKLRVPMKQITEILSNPDAAVIVDIFKENIAELDDEIATLETVKGILSQFVEKLRETTKIQLALDFMSDETALSAVETISFAKNNQKESYTVNYTMEDLNKAADKLLYKWIAPRIVHLPPATIAAIKIFDGQEKDSEQKEAQNRVKKFVKDTGLLSIKPDARTFGFNIEEDDREGYQAWVTIPENMEVSDGFFKDKFPGGLYACYSQATHDMDGGEVSFLYNWVENNADFTFDSSVGWLGCYGALEEVFILPPYNFEAKDISGGLGLGIEFYIPIKTMSAQEKKIASVKSDVIKSKNTHAALAELEKIHGVTQENLKEYRMVQFGENDWRVLDEQDGKMLVISEKILEFRAIHPELVKVSWDTSEIRGYLNGEFYNIFSDDEKARILQTKLESRKNPWYPSLEVPETDDCIFLLSLEEIVQYFGDSGDLVNRKGWHWDGTKEKYVLKKGLGQVLIDQYCTARIAEGKDGNTHNWWTRTSGKKVYGFVPVGSDGTLGAITGWGCTASNGIRPALWLSTV